MRNNLTLKLSIFGLLLVLGVACTTNLQGSKSEPLQFPSISQNPSLPPGLNLQTPTRLPRCAPLPQVPLDNGPRTPTPDINQANWTPMPYLRPSVTPIPYVNIVDLDPQMPDKDKSYVVVYRCNGTFDLYKVDPLKIKDIPLTEGDVIYFADAPLSVMEVHPFPTLITASPTEISSASMPTPYP